MEYNGIELKTAFEIFNKALELAKTQNRKECAKFLRKYAEHIYYEVNPELNGLKEAFELARANLGYIAGYHHDSIRKIIENFYDAKHPFYPDQYNLTSDQVFELDRKINNFNNINNGREDE